MSINSSVFPGITLAPSLNNADQILQFDFAIWTADLLILLLEQDNQV
jgi:hypothetical protein